ncbi:MAG: hypothetical protein IKR82_02870 [Bacteroidales bacterium]|nr:hypothetical protein [Bacteroidales bacterium]
MSGSINGVTSLSESNIFANVGEAFKTDTSYINSETKNRSNPLREIHIDGREGPPIEELSLPVIFTKIELRSEANGKLPVLTQRAGDKALVCAALCHCGRSDDRKSDQRD